MRRGTNMSKLKIASLQMNVLQDKYDNIEQLAEILADGRTEGADIISLAEMWCCPYKTELFPEYAEPEQGDAWLAMSTLARKHNVYIVGGSIPETDGEGHTYNTCYVFDRQGRQIGKNRKVNLFLVIISNLNHHIFDITCFFSDVHHLRKHYREDIHILDRL